MVSRFEPVNFEEADIERQALDALDGLFVQDGGVHVNPADARIGGQALAATDRAAWKSDPVRWAVERAKSDPWSKQREILYSVRDNPKTAVHSCHSAGKTFNAGLVTAWWIDSHPPGSAFVVTTAPTGPQVKALLWREINRLHERIGLPGRTNTTEWYIGRELVAFGRKPSDYSHSAFQGIHALYVLVILDEACGVPEDLWIAADTIASNRHSRILAIGNPDDTDGAFARACEPTSSWHRIHISYADTPNFTNEPVPDELRDLLVDPAWVEDKKIHWGEESALFQSKCLGQFPRAELDPWATVRLADVTKCRYLEFHDSGSAEGGIDVGAGGDRTVIRERRGIRAGREDVFKNPDPMSTVGQLVEKINEWGLDRVKVDVIGIGWGIYGRLRELSSRHNPQGERLHDAEVVGVNFAQQSINPRRFANKRAEIWWGARERSRLGQWDLGELDDDTVAELTTPRYEIMDSLGKIKIEPKDEVKKRLNGASPDRAEALLLAFYDGATGQPVDTRSVDTFKRSSLLQDPGAAALGPAGQPAQLARRDRSPFGNTGVPGRGITLGGRRP